MTVVGVVWRKTNRQHTYSRTPHPRDQRGHAKERTHASHIIDHGSFGGAAHCRVQQRGQEASLGAGFIITVGSNLGGQTTVGLTIATGGTGTQTIGPGTLAAANVLIGSQMWQANSFGGSGTITLTTVTSNRVVGTFTFTAKALVSSVTPATRLVTSGQFDVTY